MMIVNGYELKIGQIWVNHWGVRRQIIDLNETSKTVTSKFLPYLRNIGHGMSSETEPKELKLQNFKSWAWVKKLTVPQEHWKMHDYGFCINELVKERVKNWYTGHVFK